MLMETKSQQKIIFFYWPNMLELPETNVNSKVQYSEGFFKLLKLNKNNFHQLLKS